MNTTAAPLQPTSSSNWARKLIIGVPLALLATILLLMFYVPNCKVQGYEFNPSTWSVRHFEFWAEPFTNYQISGILHDSKPVSIDPAIIACLSKTTPKEADRWDLVELEDFHLEPNTGPAAIAVDILTTRKYFWGLASAGTVNFWTTWTTNNPRKATAFWRAAQTLTIHHAYHAVPDVLDLALTTDDQFDQMLSQTMSRALLEQAQTFAAQEDSSSAAAAAQAGLEYDANNSELEKLANSPKLQSTQ